jgi:hypothetical protein
VLRIFIALKNSSPTPDLEPANSGSSGQHTNHYTIKATSRFFMFLFTIIVAPIIIIIIIII